MTVLCYHGIDADWESVLAVDPAAFDEQCRLLARTGRVVDAGPDVRRGQHVLTFDDGFVSVYHHALPALRRHRLPATVFVVAGTLTETPVPVDWIRESTNQLPLAMTEEQVLELVDAGVAIGNHTWAHRDLTLLSEQECVEDLRESRERLEDLVRAPVPLLAYPFGFHSAHVRRAAEKSGHTLAYSLPERHEVMGQFAAPRVGIYRGNSLRTVRIKMSRPYLKLRLSRTYGRLRPQTSA